MGEPGHLNFGTCMRNPLHPFLSDSHCIRNIWYIYYICICILMYSDMYSVVGWPCVLRECTFASMPALIRIYTTNDIFLCVRERESPQWCDSCDKLTFLLPEIHIMPLECRLERTLLILFSFRQTSLCIYVCLYTPCLHEIQSLQLQIWSM